MINKIKNFLYIYTGLRSLTNAIKHWLGMNMLEAKFNQLHDEYADTIDEKVYEMVDDKSNDIQSDLEYQLELQVNDGIDDKFSDSISDAVVEYADDILPSMVNKSIEDMGVVKAKVEALEKFVEVLVDKQSLFLDELKDTALITKVDVSNALKELKEEK